MPFDNIVNFNSKAVQFPALDKTAFHAKHVDLGYQFEQQPMDVPADLARAVIRTDNGAALGLTGNRYGIAQNQDVHDVLVQSLEQALPSSYLKDIELEEQVSGNGAFCKTTYRFPSAAEPIRQLRNATGFKSDVYGKQHKETWLELQFSWINSFGGKTPLIIESGVKSSATRANVIRHCLRHSLKNRLRTSRHALKSGNNGQNARSRRIRPKRH